MVSIDERFAAKTQRDIDSECILWTGARDRRGYGRFGIGASRTVFAHRFSLEGVASVRARAARGESHRSIARELGVNQSTITRIVRAQRWALA